MKINLYSIKDILNGFAPPIVMPNHYTAKRWYCDMCEENPTMKNNKNDFSIHFIGTLDTETGYIEPSDKIYLQKDLFENEELPTEEDYNVY